MIHVLMHGLVLTESSTAQYDVKIFLNFALLLNFPSAVLPEISSVIIGHRANFAG